MGFFSPGNSKNRYMGIWYKETLPVRTVVWVANRKTPLTDISGELKLISDPGILVLANGSSNIIWSTNTSRPAQGPVLLAQLLDSGNLVVKDTRTDDGNFLWRSFDYPSDTLLRGMKVGKNFETALERYLSSWKSNDDPSPGDFTYHCDPSGYPQNVIKKGSVEQYRSGSWNGVQFIGAPSLVPNAIYKYSAERGQVVDTYCDTYSLCGAYGTCNIGVSPQCKCLDKFAPKYSDAWANISQMGELGRHPWLATKTGQTDFSSTLMLSCQTLEECEKVGLNNCSCTAYANLAIRDRGSGCLLWFGDLIDI
ncbi:LOW QUALITY PROTEIN: hypothetical protein RJ640_009696 [Escallonia rubra]|uniref:Bulb-type lectin domain-containing protein n=1 Tax=Escallonia rubra TaxID=112253 RepID=A0AA88QUW7_9ASTE|nr:LOW QUALITY PROTEIN: hypothetical protein RJ640_009696 [Escallonia rubra]